MLDVLRDEEIFEGEITLEDAQKFLEHNIKADESYEVYACLRRVSYDGKKRKK
jgi:hypothetical protein